MPVVAARGAALLLGAALLTGCAARPPRPQGTGTETPESVAVFADATRACAGLRTLTAELALSGHAGDQSLRGRVIAGLERGGAVRLEGVAPFGAPLFILAARQEAATLLLPRDRRVLRDASVAEVLERLTGLPLAADELREALTGCLGAGESGQGRAWSGGWRGVTLTDGRTVLIRSRDGVPRVVAADAGGWRADYGEWLNDLPRRVRLRSTDGRVDLVARLQQVEVNTAIAPEAFAITIPDGTPPMTLDDLRSMAPLRTP
jgi:outer membrane biogenesis lipoprotein LolB